MSIVFPYSMAFTEVNNITSIVGDADADEITHLPHMKQLNDSVTSLMLEFLNSSLSSLTETSTDLITHVNTNASNLLTAHESNSFIYSSSSISPQSTVHLEPITDISTSHVTSPITPSTTLKPPLSGVISTPAFAPDILNEDGLEVLRTHWKIIIVACSVFVLATLIVLAYVIHKRRRYNIVEEEEEIVPYDYIYKPVQGNYIDEMYENTFVGVSIPLLQDVTKV